MDFWERKDRKTQLESLNKRRQQFATGGPVLDDSEDTPQSIKHRMFESQEKANEWNFKNENLYTPLGTDEPATPSISPRLEDDPIKRS